MNRTLDSLSNSLSAVIKPLRLFFILQNINNNDVFALLRYHAANHVAEKYLLTKQVHEHSEIFILYSLFFVYHSEIAEI